MAKKSTHDILEKDISADFDEVIKFEGHRKKYKLAEVTDPRLQASVPAGVDLTYPFDDEYEVGEKGCTVHVLKPPDIKPGIHAYQIGPQPCDIRSITVPCDTD